MVINLLNDLENIDKVNEKLKEMGSNIGERIIDEFLYRTDAKKCESLRDVSEAITRAIKMMLGSDSEVIMNEQNRREFKIRIKENPLANFVEIPKSKSKLIYCNVLCGILEGALEMVKINAEAKIVESPLKGGNDTVISIEISKDVEQT